MTCRDTAEVIQKFFNAALSNYGAGGLCLRRHLDQNYDPPHHDRSLELVLTFLTSLLDAAAHLQRLHTQHDCVM